MNAEEILLQAASLMRERAERATRGPWVDDDSTPASCVYSPSADEFVTAPFDWDAGGGDTEHIASWHPVVTFAVADLLEAAANQWVDDPGCDLGGGMDGPPCGSCYRCCHWTSQMRAEGVARIYLGAVPS